MTDSPQFYVEEFPGVTGAYVMRPASILCAVPLIVGGCHMTRAAAEAEAARLNGLYAASRALRIQAGG